MPVIKLIGLDAMLAKMQEQVVAVKQGAVEGVTTGAAEIKLATQRTLSLSWHPPGTPTPSRPGTPPSMVSGDLHDSVKVRVSGGVSNPRAVIGATTVYARIQELGGVTGRNHATTLPPRPYLKPALELSKKGVRAAFLEAWIEAL